MDLEKTLQVVHQVFEQEQIDHALIGGLALATLGINRATYDVDMLIDFQDKEKAKQVLAGIGFILHYESKEVCQFSGIGYLDLLLAQRPISREMLRRAEVYSLHGIKCLAIEDVIGLKIQAFVNDSERELQDKADIVALIHLGKALDWARLKQYAELFNQWEFLKKYKNQ